MYLAGEANANPSVPPSPLTVVKTDVHDASSVETWSLKFFAAAASQKILAPVRS